MRKEALKEVCVDLNEANPLDITNLSVKTAIISDYLKLQSKHIEKYIPKQKGIRSSNCLDLLLLIKSNPRYSAANINLLLNGTYRFTIRNIKYIELLGLIKPIGKPRLIVPFQKFKVDTGYVITHDGERLLQKILG